MLRALTLGDMEPIRKWRNESLDTLRTPFPLTMEQQEDWYRNEICNRASRSRFWAVETDIGGTQTLIGYGGIENIQWENRIGEISLLIDPTRRGKKYGSVAAVEIIRAAFDRLNLKTVYAECYESNPATWFWRRVFEMFHGTETRMPNRKYLGGKYYGSIYLSASV